MNILGIDTALEACSVGLSIAGSNAAIIRSELVERGHAERLFALVEMVIGESELGLDQIQRFAVTIGPGSFTGIRVGVAAVRGFALVSGMPALGFSTLAVHAESARSVAGERPVLASLLAKGGEVFAQLFGPSGEELSEAMVASAKDAAEIAANADAMLAGSGSPTVADAADSGLAIAHRNSAPDIAALLRLGKTSAGQAVPPKPLYLKPPDARPAPATLARR